MHKAGAVLSQVEPGMDFLCCLHWKVTSGGDTVNQQHVNCSLEVVTAQDLPHILSSTALCCPKVTDIQLLHSLVPELEEYSISG